MISFGHCGEGQIKLHSRKLLAMPSIPRFLRLSFLALFLYYDSCNEEGLTKSGLETKS